MTIWTEVIGPYSLTGKPRAVNNSCLRPSTEQVIQEDWTSAMAKEGIVKWCRTCGYDNVNTKSHQKSLQ